MRQQHHHEKRGKETPKFAGHHCNRSHEPNAETAKVLRETDRGENLIEPENLDEFWDALGFSQYDLPAGTLKSIERQANIKFGEKA